MEFPVGAQALRKGLRAGAVGLLATTVIGAASTAPAYSLASALGPLASHTGPVSPLVLILAALPMLLIAVAFKELNSIEPDCGTSFAWVSRAFGPRAGWLAGWSMIVPCVLVMANLAQVAAVYSYRAIGADHWAESRSAQAMLGLTWILVLTIVCYRGIRATARLQFALLLVEAGLLLLLAGVAISRVISDGGVGRFVPSTEQITALDGGQWAAGFMVAVFLYWGWDSAVAVNEETDKPDRTPGRAALLSLAVVVLGYAVVSSAMFAYVGSDEVAAESSDVFAALGPSILGNSAGLLLTIAVLLSAAASAQTTILPTVRALLAMGAYRALPGTFSRIHPQYLTPSVATVAMGVASAAVFTITISISENVLADSVTATALTICLYYALTGLACPWYFRQALHGPRDVLMRAVLPFTGGLIMTAGMVWTCVDLATGESAAGKPLGIGLPLWVAVGSLLLGVVVMVFQMRREPEFFAGKLAGPGDTVADGLARVPVPEKTRT